MGSLIKIKEVSAKYSVSARTLRYYEDMGLLVSTRSDDYAYRLYDENAVQRLEKILILRKLNISIKDIQRIFSTSGSEVVLEVLGKKVDAIDEEVSLLHELKEIVLDFIQHIEQADFGKESDIKLLYEKAKEIETQIVNTDYNGNPATSNVKRLLEVTEKLDRKIPDIIVVKLPKCRVVSSGFDTMDKIFGKDGFDKWIGTHPHITKSVIFDVGGGWHFYSWKGDKIKFVWAIKDEVTEADVAPYEIVEFEGGLYASAVCIDEDNASYHNVWKKIMKWIESTNFIHDDQRETGTHMIFIHDDIKKGLGYDQLQIYVPIKLRIE